MNPLDREWDLAAAELEAAWSAAGEREDGPGQRAAKERLLEALRLELQRTSGQNFTREATLQVVADAGGLLDAKGAPQHARRDGGNKGRLIRPEPDLAYNAVVGGVNRRVNIEVDSDPRAAARHLRELRQGDRRGWHVALIVDPVSGVPVDGVFWNPAGKRARRLNSGEVTALRSGQLPPALIPAPLPDQRNVAVPPRRPRNPARIANTLDAVVRKLNGPTRRKAASPPRRTGARESEFDAAAAEWSATFA